LPVGWPVAGAWWVDAAAATYKMWTSDMLVKCGPKFADDSN